MSSKSGQDAGDKFPQNPNLHGRILTKNFGIAKRYPLDFFEVKKDCSVNSIFLNFFKKIQWKKKGCLVVKINSAGFYGLVLFLLFLQENPADFWQPNEPLVVFKKWLKAW